MKKRVSELVNGKPSKYEVTVEYLDALEAVVDAARVVALDVVTLEEFDTERDALVAALAALDKEEDTP